MPRASRSVARRPADLAGTPVRVGGTDGHGSARGWTWSRSNNTHGALGGGCAAPERPGSARAGPGGDRQPEGPNHHDGAGSRHTHLIPSRRPASRRRLSERDPAAPRLASRTQGVRQPGSPLRLDDPTTRRDSGRPWLNPFNTARCGARCGQASRLRAVRCPAQVASHPNARDARRSECSAMPPRWRAARG